MLTGLLFAVATGIAWACVSMVMSSVANKKISKYLFYTLGATIAAVLSWLLMADRSAAMSVIRENFAAAALFFAAGVVNVSSQSVMVHTLKIGHNGISIAIRNCASLIPFTIGALFLNSRVSFTNIAGLILVLAALSLIAFKRSGGENSGKLFSTVWLLWSLLSMLLSGTFQSINTLLSVKYNIFVTTGLATPILMAMCALGYGTAFLVESRGNIRNSGCKISSGVLYHAAAWGVLAVTAYFLMFNALTIMNEHHASAMVFPVVTGVSVSVFSIYSKFKLREPYSWLNVSCLILCVAGIILLNRR